MRKLRSRDLNRSVSRINEGHFTTAKSTYVSVTKLYIVHKNSPVIKTNIWIIVNTFFTPIYLGIVKESKRNLRSTCFVIWILKVETNLQIINFVLIKQLIDIRPFMIIRSQSNDSICFEITDDTLDWDERHGTHAHISTRISS